MILIADSGSTKTDWSLVADGTLLRRLYTPGINPFFQTEEEIRCELLQSLLPQLPEADGISAIHYYGAGCTPEKAPLLRHLLVSAFPTVQHCEVESDLLGVARSLCGHEAGIACILGTGSNSCYYDGREVAAHVPPLGFILGDEGSGAALGKQLVSDVLKGQLPTSLRDAFYEETKLTAAILLDRVYRQPFPNRFLAGLSPFIARHIDVPELEELVRSGFVRFLRRNVTQYEYTLYPAHFTGSIASRYSKQLMEAAEATGVRIGKVCQNPMDGLVAYHS
ncbi:MAG: ATPase [Mediterranea sp.]|jgi:N-acetylglucosamine kinase-like BadF-type ATPase|nr:ATPase [Mediterranea sp.]